MTYATPTIAASGTFRAAMQPVLEAAGFTRVTAGYAANLNNLRTGATAQAGTLDVYRSTGGASGEDWYLLVGEYVVGGVRHAVLSVAESWDDTGKTAVRGSPQSNNISPAADFSMGATPTAPANLAYVSIGSWTDTSGTGLQVSATLDRVYALIPSTSGCYAGKLHRTYPTTIDPVVPLVVVRIDTGASSTQAGYGLGTREPGQGGASTFNFRVQLAGSTTAACRTDAVLKFGADSAVADAVTGRLTASPFSCHCSRFPTTTVRGIFRGGRFIDGASASLFSDTLVETRPDGTTKTYLALNVANQYFEAV